MSKKNTIIELKNKRFSLDTFLNEPEKVFNIVKEFESLHKYCHGEPPRRGGLIYPHTTPLICDYIIEFVDGHTEDIVSMNCAIHEEDYNPKVQVLFVFKEMPDDKTIRRLRFMFKEHMIHAFMDYHPSLMDLKHYIQEHVSKDDIGSFINFYYYLLKKYYGGKRR